MLQHKNKRGYFRLKLMKNKIGKLFLVHRLVAESFIQNFDNKPFVGHIDNDPSNSKVDNLVWCTQLENVRYCKKCNRLAYVGGNKNPRAILKEDDVRKIRGIGKNNVSYKEIAKMFNVSSSTISAILNYQCWKNI